jgi:transposase
MPPGYVKPYVKRGKNDRADAEAICERLSRRRLHQHQPQELARGADSLQPLEVITSTRRTSSHIAVYLDPVTARCSDWRSGGRPSR